MDPHGFLQDEPHLYRIDPTELMQLEKVYEEKNFDEHKYMDDAPRAYMVAPEEDIEFPIRYPQ